MFVLFRLRINIFFFFFTGICEASGEGACKFGTLVVFLIAYAELLLAALCKVSFGIV